MGSGTPGLAGANQAYHLAQDRMALLPNYYAWTHAYLGPYLSGTVVELGAGAGHLLRHYVSRVDRVIAVDHNALLLDRLRLLHPAEKVVPVLADLSGDWSALAGIAADAVLALDVLEHFEDDDRLVARIRGLLKSGGRLLVKVPAQSRLFGAMDRASGHFRRYDPGTLAALMQRHGFQVIAQRPMNPVGALLYRAKRRKKSNFSRSVSPGALRLANRLIPLLRLLDRLPGVEGLSLVGVYEKR